MANQKRTSMAWCGLLLLAVLATAWVGLRLYVRNPMSGSCVFDLGTDSLVYCNKTVSFNYVDPTTRFTKVKLDTGKIETASFHQTTLATYPLGGGERLRYRTTQNGQIIGFEIFDAKSGARRIESKLREPLNMPVIVGDRYLVGFGIDRNAVSSLQIVDAYAGDAVAELKSVSISPQPRGLYRLERIPLRGTSLFAVGVRSAQTTTQKAQEDVVIFEIKEGETREVARWKSGCSPANIVEQDGKLFSLSADAQHVEVRELPTLQLIEQRPLPIDLATQWSSVRFRDGLGRLDNRTNGRTEFFRLTDFKRLELPSGFHFFQLFEDPIERRVLLARRSGREIDYVVIDPVAFKIIFQHSASVNSTAALLDDHRLGICDLNSVVTIDLFDIATGKVIQRWQPYAWLDWWIPLLALGSLATCVFWIYAANVARLSAFISNLTLTAIVGGVSLFGCVYDGTEWQVDRPCMCYLLAVMTCMMYVSGWYTALAASHVARRWLVLIVSLCVVLQVITFVLFSDDDVPGFFPMLAMFIVAVPALVATLLLWVASFMGLGWKRDDDGSLSGTHRQQLALTDYFWLTAVAGLLIVSLNLLLPNLWNVDNFFFLLQLPVPRMLPLLALIPALVAIFALSRSRMIQRTMFVLMLMAAVYLFVDAARLFWYGPESSRFFSLTLWRIAIAMGFSSYLYFKAWQLEGWCLKWRAHLEC